MLRRPRTRSCPPRWTNWWPKGPGGCWPPLWRPRSRPTLRASPGRWTTRAIAWWSARTRRGPVPPDRSRTHRGPGAPGRRPSGRRGDRGEEAVPVVDPAPLGPQVPEGGRGAAVDVPARDELGGLRARPGGVLRIGGRAVGLGGHPAHHRVAEGTGPVRPSVPEGR